MVDVIDENAINVYTDGSCYSSPRCGGMGILFVVVDERSNEMVFEERPLGYRSATNQQMEPQACIEALEVLASRTSPVDPAQFQKISVKTDSAYVVDNDCLAGRQVPASYAPTHQCHAHGLRLVEKVAADLNRTESPGGSVKPSPMQTLKKC